MVQPAEHVRHLVRQHQRRVEGHAKEQLALLPAVNVAAATADQGCRAPHKVPEGEGRRNFLLGTVETRRGRHIGDQVLKKKRYVLNRLHCRFTLIS